MADTPTFTYNRDQIIRRALRLVTISSGEIPGSQEVSDACDALNAKVAEWQASGLHIWKEKEGVLFLQPSTYNYGLGGAGTANVCPAESLIAMTTANVVLAVGVDVIPIATTNGQFFQPGGSFSGYTGDFNSDYNADFGTSFSPEVGDNFGVMMSNNQLFWSTVTGVSGSSITIASPLPQTVNASAIAFDYSQLVSGAPSPCAIYRPLRVLNVRRILWSSLIETMVSSLSRLDYRNMPNKTQTGVVTQYYYDPQMNIGLFWAWPNPQDSLNGLLFTYMEPIYDFNASSDYPDFPQEWVNCLVWNLANEIMTEYDVGGERAARIEKRAMETLDAVSGWDREPESYFLGVNFDQTSR